MTTFDRIAAFLQPDVVDELAWRNRAACLGRWNRENYFPEKGESADAAKRVCLRCPVRAECLTYALGNHLRDGCWGGTTEKERRPLLRRVEAGEPVGAVVASALPKVRLGWRPSSPVSAAYGQYLARRASERRGVAA